MLEHFEIIELEEKWNEYNKNKGNLSKNLGFKKSVIIAFLTASVFLGLIFWLVFSNKKENIEVKTAQTSVKSETLPSVKSTEVEKNNTLDKKKSSDKRGELNFNNIGINSSVDAGGFILNNTYEQDKQSFSKEEKTFSSIPKDEIIDFGNPPVPPQTVSSRNHTKVENTQKKGKVIIKTAPLKVDKNSLEEKFYASNDILYSLKLAQNAYDNKRYDEAIKWALISNEIDKDSAKSWILFAKANYKKGNKQDALIALENFNSRVTNPEVIATIKQMKNGDLR
ncbi:CDC27 family protein [Campylobacter ureolyticus]|uniref:CDC27 family protein n=1 Tax=Campylobacter ureolyticus TaxID=827 RepID=A0A9Q4KLC9_9BACT|nr:CDC27 family protein [Campylobacter ureolyticus]MCZ6103566.1 CDC27 family protein [Campylobacter ureolyticus]MCZ6134008.1 CDC27 family protein [Campylobacter ureolyticus]MCZ6161748.1 CDC27 family protein [Campylobacter ureolyticus]MCZ6170662.1 CDC27 family protein [Campylobacter ureolyticus]MDU4981970.1 CDC27 family protein [Campylobacter ureolyticus]